jgi:hypothetical protein
MEIMAEFLLLILRLFMIPLPVINVSVLQIAIFFLVIRTLLGFLRSMSGSAASGSGGGASARSSAVARGITKGKGG